MIKTRANIIISVFGRKYCGKSYLANSLARVLLDNGRRVIVLDPSASFGLPVPIYHNSYYDTFAELNGRSAIFRPATDQDGFRVIEFCYWLGETPADTNLWLIVDEVDFYLGPHQYSEPLMRLIRYGRHRGVSLICVCQRPAAVNKALVSQADYKIFFQVTEPNDLAYISKWTGIDPDSLRSLPERKFIVRR